MGRRGFAFLVVFALLSSSVILLVLSTANLNPSILFECVMKKDSGGECVSITTYSSPSRTDYTARFPYRSTNRSLEIDLVVHESRMDLFVSSSSEDFSNLIYESLNCTSVSVVLSIGGNIASVMTRGTNNSNLTVSGNIIARCLVPYSDINLEAVRHYNWSPVEDSNVYELWNTMFALGVLFLLTALISTVSLGIWLGKKSPSISVEDSPMPQAGSLASFDL